MTGRGADGDCHQQALSHPWEDKPSPYDPSQQPEPEQTGAWSHLSDKIWRTLKAVVDTNQALLRPGTTLSTRGNI